MIRTLHRTRGASALGARHPGEPGPFGPYGADEEQLLDEDDEQHVTAIRRERRRTEHRYGYA